LITDYPYKILKKNHATGIPRNVIYLDTETKTQEKHGFIHHRMKLAWICSNRYDKKGTVLLEKWLPFRSTSGLWSYIFSLARVKSSLYVFAHNAFFDLQCSDFFHYAYKDGWKLEFVHEEGMTFILIVTKGLRRLKLISSTNYFPSSLASLGENLSYPKGEIDFEKATDQELSSYCKRDVEILKKVMEFYFTFILEHDLGKFSLTLPSQTMRAFRHRFNSEKICLHTNEKAIELERLSYFGGRVEAFAWRQQKDGPFVTLDVNSMYPSIMRNHYVPVQLLDIKENPTLQEATDILKRFCVIAEIEVDTDKPIYAIRQKHKLIFPVGRFTAYVTTHGLTKALAMGHVKKINIMNVYRRAMLFNEYVDFFFGMKRFYKEKGNKPFEKSSKLFLNSFYGKFGQKRIVTDEYEDAGNISYFKECIFDLDKGTWIDEIHLLGKIIVKKSEGEGPNSFVAIASHITEGSRLRLWELIDCIGQNKVLYCDTDSLIVRKKDIEPLKPFLDKYKLGALDIQKEYKELDLMGAKSYRMDKVTKIKGIPKKAQKIDKYQYKYTAFFKQATHLNERVSRSFLTREVIKDVTPKYDKGVILDSGQIVPFQLESSGLSLRRLS